MSTISARFPMELTIQIANILYFQECFVELESVINIFPELNILFGHKVPTIALVDDDQYHKFSGFVHSRERPFGSRDLFIIKQKRNFTPDRDVRYESKYFIVLGSRCLQESIVQSLEQNLGRYAVLVKKENALLFDSSYKCYEIVWKPDDSTDDPRMRSILPILYYKMKLRYSFVVGILLNAFLKPSNPRLLRFKAYSGKNDLYFEWEDLYSIYSSFISARYPADSYSHTTLPDRDCKMNMPKCSFEFIKDVNQLTSLYQFSNLLNPDTLEYVAGYSVIRWFKKKLGYTYGDKLNTTAFFNNLKSLTAERVISNRTHDQRNTFLFFNCSRSATPNRSAYQFVQSYFFYVSKKLNKVYRTHERSVADHFFLKGSYGPDYIVRLPEDQNFHYLDLLHLDFSIEKLQSVDITAAYVPSRKSTKYSIFKKSFPELDEKEADVADCSNHGLIINVKVLENKLNRILNLIQELRGLDEKVPQHEMLCGMFSKHIMSTIVEEVTTNIENEGLNKEQPLKIRVFQNDIQKLNLADKNDHLDTWFSKYCWNPPIQRT